MTLEGNALPFYSSKELDNKLKSGLHSVELNFCNLASGSDATGDLGSSRVKPKNSLETDQSTSST